MVDDTKQPRRYAVVLHPPEHDPRQRLGVGEMPGDAVSVQLSASARIQEAGTGGSASYTTPVTAA